MGWLLRKLFGRASPANRWPIHRRAPRSVRQARKLAKQAHVADRARELSRS